MKTVIRIVPPREVGAAALLVFLLPAVSLFSGPGGQALTSVRHLEARAAAQETADSTTVAAAATEPVPDTAAWIAVAERPRGTVVSVSVTFPVGSERDELGKGGTAWLLAETLQRTAEQALGPTFRVSADVDRGTFHISLLAPPEDWESGLGTLSTILMERDIAGDVLESARARLVNRMAFEAGAPVREFEVEAARLYASGQADWARAPDGVPESLQAIGVADLNQYRRRNLSRGSAAAAVVGPVETATAVATVARTLGSGPDARGSRPSVAWSTADRVMLARDITNAALTHAYPLPADHSRTDAEFLAHVLTEKLVSDPPDPGVYDVTSRVLDTPSGPLVVVQAVVFPDESDDWDRKIHNAVSQLRLQNPNEDVYFPWQHRRFRALALEGDAAPEALGRRLTADLLRSGAVRDLNVETRNVTARSLVLLANALGPARVLIFGPDLGAQQDR